MGGTREGRLKAAQTLKQKDPDYFKKLRARAKNVGGKHAANGFDADPERARSAGAKGGRVSRRSKAGDDDQKEVQQFNFIVDKKVTVSPTVDLTEEQVEELDKAINQLQGEAKADATRKAKREASDQS